ncbi:hypothetical protein TorRG33x02_084410 [Trema orientale]|uniref:Uncharacterized protein n=1 Tax=Trema orientale TaxID=63057 RepID=A0A2P5FCU1_TREOI|nr:hypothetical protein TorRG33x02_084410 [Trema orientale]
MNWRKKKEEKEKKEAQEKSKIEGEDKQEIVDGINKANHEAKTVSKDDDKIGLVEDSPLDQMRKLNVVIQMEGLQFTVLNTTRYLFFLVGDDTTKGAEHSPGFRLQSISQVKLRCGLKNEITDVDKPSRCEYIYVALLSTPALCVGEKLKYTTKDGPGRSPWLIYLSHKSLSYRSLQMQVVAAANQPAHPLFILAPAVPFDGRKIISQSYTVVNRTLEIPAA